MSGFLGGLAGSWLGWKLGAPLGFLTGFAVSTVCTGLGVFAAKKFARSHWG